jgi:low affinity Fe/Cu permease
LLWGFRDGKRRYFQILVAALTLAMVFVIQHTQARQQAATQRKLNEIPTLAAAGNTLTAIAALLAPGPAVNNHDTHIPGHPG